MLVCSCNVITRSEIEDVIRDFLSSDPWQIITPLKVYHAIEKRGRCCGCFPNVISIIIAQTHMYHREVGTDEADIVPFVAKIKVEHERYETSRKLMQARVRQK